MQRAIIGGLAMLAVLACQDPEARPAPDPIGSPGRFEASWHGLPPGTRPREFALVSSPDYPWLYDGGWQITHPASGPPVLEVPCARVDLAEPLTFLRYRGTAFGRPGTLPPRYRLRATARSMGGARRFAGFGEVAIQVAYFSPVSYVEVLQTDRDFMIWQADGAAPMQGAGWQLLASTPHAMRIGDWFSFEAVIDRAAGTVEAQASASAHILASSSLLARAPAPGLTLRATGNREQFRSLTLEELR